MKNRVPFSYASLLLAGREQLEGEATSSCGRENEADMRATAVAHWIAGGATVAVEQLELAVAQGSHQGGYLLALLLLSGLGGTAARGGASTGRYDIGQRETKLFVSRINMALQ